MKKYWHEMSDKERDKIHSKKSKLTWGDVRKIYKPPDWCGVGIFALDALGCWSLIDGDIRKAICKEFCESCPEFRK